MIIKTMHEKNTAARLYNMTRGANRQPLRNLDGDHLDLADYCIFTDISVESGEEITCLTMVDSDGCYWTTNGATFVREFQAIVEIMEQSGETLQAIDIVHRQSNKGRTYTTCVLPE